MGGVIRINLYQLEQAIRTGRSYGGEYRLCGHDGAVYWRHWWASDVHETHDSILVPALYPDGYASREWLFRDFVRRTVFDRPHRLRGLLAEGWHVDCVIARCLRQDERALWEHYLRARVRLEAEGCLQELISRHPKSRYRFDQPFATAAS